MAALAPGILLNLINGMNATTVTSGHRSSLLQVTDIVPAGLDEENLLFPKNGFYIKISDSSHSIYVALPSGQDDFVLSNKVQLGQFIYVDRLEPGSPVPVIKGAKPLPGRHPLVGTTEPLMGETIKPVLVSKRASWGAVSKPVRLEFDQCTTNPVCDWSGSMRKPLTGRYPLVGTTEPLVEEKIEPVLVSKRASWGIGPKGGNRNSVSKLVRLEFDQCITGPVSDRSGSMRKLSVSTMVQTMSARESMSGGGSRASLKFPQFGSADLIPEDHRAADEFANLSGRLSTLGKEAIQWQKTTRKIALRALREATATETLFGSLKIFSTLVETARADAPAACFDRFLEFHRQIVLAAANTASDPIEENDENMKPLSSSCHISNTIELGKQIEAESVKWFMEFLETVLESEKLKGDTDPKKVPQSLILKVINWIEVEQCNNNSNNKLHSKAGQIARKLRIKMKNA